MNEWVQAHCTAWVYACLCNVNFGTVKFMARENSIPVGVNGRSVLPTVEHDSDRMTAILMACLHFGF